MIHFYFILLYCVIFLYKNLCYTFCVYIEDLPIYYVPT